MTDPKPIPQVPAALCGLYPGATIRFPLDGAIVTGKANPFNAVYNNQVRTVHLVGGADGVAYSAVEIGKVDLLLNSPLAMCHAARWLAGRLGWDMRWIATAPTWERVRTDKGPEWVLRTRSNALNASDVPGISDLTDPAEALAAACVAVGGAG